MVARAKQPARPAPPPASVADDSPSEHIYIGSEELGGDPATSARTLRATLHAHNPLRHMGIELALYEEGVVRVTELRKGKPAEPFFLDLRFLDPVPTIERSLAKRWLMASLGCTAIAALAAFLLRFDALYVPAMATLVVSALAAATALYGGIYRSHERTEFRTLHGRTTVLRFMANLGSFRKFRALVPAVSGAIEEAAERITADTAAYLRAEMREHYRLRGASVLDNETCAAGTGRILAQFDIQI